MMKTRLTQTLTGCVIGALLGSAVIAAQEPSKPPSETVSLEAKYKACLDKLHGTKADLRNCVTERDRHSTAALEEKCDALSAAYTAVEQECSEIAKAQAHQKFLAAIPLAFEGIRTSTSSCTARVVTYTSLTSVIINATLAYAGADPIDEHSTGDKLSPDESKTFQPEQDAAIAALRRDCSPELKASGYEAPKDGKPVGVLGGVDGGMMDQPLYAGIGGVTNPELIPSSKVAPHYPDIARKAKVQGEVILQAIVHKDGTVGDVTVLKSPGSKFGFDEEAIAAVKQWKWKPSLQNGMPVDVYFTVVVDFTHEMLEESQ